MSDITENLHGVLQNIARNRNQVAQNLVQVDQAVSQLDEASLASVRQLLAKFEHPQSIGQFVNAVAQQDGLNKALGEMDAAIAVLQTAADDEAFKLQAQAQWQANEAARNSPLPAAGAGSESAPATPNVATGGHEPAPETAAPAA